VVKTGNEEVKNSGRYAAGDITTLDGNMVLK